MECLLWACGAQRQKVEVRKIQNPKSKIQNRLRRPRARRMPKPADVKRTRRKAQLVLFSLLIAECVAGLLTSPALAIRKVTITGVGGLQEPEAASVIGSATTLSHANWLRAPIYSVEQSLRSMAWVRAVHVTRQFPDRANVHLSLRQPTLILQTGICRYEMDDEGMPIRLAASATSGLPRVIFPPAMPVRCGVRIDDPSLATAAQILRQTRQGTAVRIAKIEVDQSHNLCLNMQDGILIRIGQAESINTKMAIIRRIYTRRPDIARTLATIDVTCPSAPACRLRAPQPPPADRPALNIDRFD